jgi:hypothetical protein
MSPSSVLKMEAVCSSETLSTCKSTWRYIPKNQHGHLHHYENVMSHMMLAVCSREQESIVFLLAWTVFHLPLPQLYMALIGQYSVLSGLILRIPLNNSMSKPPVLQSCKTLVYNHMTTVHRSRVDPCKECESCGNARFRERK